MSNDDCIKAVYDFLYKNNRPQGLTEIIGIFSGQYKEYPVFKKNQVIAALEALRDNEDPSAGILEKVYGKQKVYSINQAAFKTKSPEELEALKNEVNKLKAELNSLQAKYKKLVNEEKQHSAYHMSMDEIEKQLDEHKLFVEDYEKRMSSMVTLNDNETGKQLTLSVTKKKKIELLSELKKRRKIFLEMVDTVHEHYPNSKKELYEEIGIDPDHIERLNEQFRKVNE
ncbi:hypothetical protein ACOME3_008506 [Neoechinorhynchus agilis]